MADYGPGTRGDAASVIQRALKAKGFYLSSAVDGVYGRLTEQAIREFQNSIGLPITGIADRATQNALGLAVTDAPAGGSDFASKLRAQYPQLAWALDVPDLASVISQMDTMDPAAFQAAIYGSDWYRKNQASIRENAALRNVDPATWNARLSTQKVTIQNLAMSMGISDQNVINQVAEQSLSLGWGDAEIRQTLAAHAGGWGGGGDQPGSIYSTKNAVIAGAADWGVPMAEATAWEWAKRITAGSMSLEDLTPYLQEQAKSLFPSIAGAIDQGISVRQYFDPYVQTAVQELGINPADINLADPKWNRALNAVSDPSRPGVRQPMNLNDWTKTLRTDPMYGWDFTPKAKEQAAQFATQTLQRMGMMS